MSLFIMGFLAGVCFTWVILVVSEWWADRPERLAFREIDKHAERMESLSRHPSRRIP